MRASFTFLMTALMALTMAACNGVEVRPAETDTFAAGNYRYYSWRSKPIVNTANSRDPMYRLDPILREAINTALQAKVCVMGRNKEFENIETTSTKHDSSLNLVTGAKYGPYPKLM